METLVNPTTDGTGLRITSTLQSLQSWRDAHAKLLQQEMGTLTTHKVTTIGQQQCP